MTGFNESTFREVRMPVTNNELLERDETLEKGVGTIFGRYLGTFISERKEVRADIFDTGTHVIAHISFPTGLDLGEVQDQYVSKLHEYAERQGFAKRFRLVYAS
jgi:hypothetical protein